MHTVKAILFVSALAIINFSLSSFKNATKDIHYSPEVTAFSQELCDAYNLGENLILVDLEGNQIINPNKSDLLKLAPKTFNQNKIRLTIWSKSDNNLCSTELVIANKSGGMIGNYGINDCSSYGWIFFTEGNCFDLSIYHDAGFEAPNGSSVNGSVDWSFQFNNKPRITGTYMDRGLANMFTVASPCFDGKQGQLTAMETKKRIDLRNNPLGQ